MSATPAFEGNYTPGAWLPIEVSLTNNGPSLQILLAAELPDARYRHTMNINLPSGAQKTTLLYVSMDQTTREVHLSAERDEEVLITRQIDVRPRTGERMLSIISDQPLTIDLPRRQDLERLPFTAFHIDISSLPDKAAGLSSLSLALIHDASTESLTPAQHDALFGWVSNGGHLIIGGGPLVRHTVAGLHEELQAAAIGDDAMVDASALVELADSTGPERVAGVALKPLVGARVVGSPEAPVWVERVVGKGRVTQLAFDPALPALEEWEAVSVFWDRLLQPTVFINTPFGLQSNTDVIQEQLVTGALSALPPVSLPPADILFAILVIYTILVGPGIALFLRRRDRQAWSWVIVPATTVGVAMLTFSLAYTLRADQRIISQASLIEEMINGKFRARTLLAILSPQTQTFAIETPSEALLRSLRSASGLYGSVDSAGGDLAQQSSITNIVVDRWQLQGVLAEQQLALTGIDARITLDDRKPWIEVHNSGSQTLRQVAAVYGERIVHLGDVPPDGQASAIWPETRDAETSNGVQASFLVLRNEIEAAQQPGQAPDRQTQIREALINAAVIRNTAERDEGPFVFAWLEHSPLTLETDIETAARQETTLVVIRPAVVGNGSVLLPEGWLRPDITASERSVCFGNEGAGISASPAPLTVTLRLPEGFSLFQAEAMTLTLNSTQRWPNSGITTELYDWQREQWVEIDFDGPGDIALSSAEPYLRNSQAMLRLSGRIDEAACLYIQASIYGALP